MSEGDWSQFSPNWQQPAPTIVTVTEVEGARIHLQLVNASPEEVRLDMPVEFVFRRIHETGGRPNYYWKATPVESDLQGREAAAQRAGAPVELGPAERSRS